MRQIIRYKNIFLLISAVLVAAAAAAIIFIGFNPGVDFSGGSLWQLRLPEEVNEAMLKNFLESKLAVEQAVISYDSDSRIFSILLPTINTETKINYLEAIRLNFGNVEEVDFWSASPGISMELKNKAFLAVGLVLAAISLYITFAFSKVSRPISSYKYGIITLITLAHDVLIAAGFFAVLGYFKGLMIDTNFVVALLVIMGFSVHDTIVVFDRIRENILGYRRGVDLGAVVNQSINETFRRSINTSLTLILVLIAVFFFGPASIKYFVLTILIGTVVGTYSSIFVASPLLVLWHNLSANRLKSRS